MNVSLPPPQKQTNDFRWKGGADSSKSIVIFGLFGGFKPIGFHDPWVETTSLLLQSQSETPIILNDLDMTYAYKSASYPLVN